MQSNGFFIVPYKELQELPLTRVQFYVYAYILNYCKNNGECTASIATIASATRWDERAVRGALSDLLADGYILRDFSNGKTPVYKINPGKNDTPAKNTAVISATLPGKICHGTPAKSATHIIKNNKEKENIPARVREEEGIPEEFREIMGIWFAYKKERKETYKDKGSRAKCFARLYKLSGGSLAKAVEIVEQSMANNWAGLFELKTSGTRQQVPTVSDDITATRKRMQDADQQAAQRAQADQHLNELYKDPEAIAARDHAIAKIKKLLKSTKI